MQYFSCDDKKKLEDLLDVKKKPWETEFLLWKKVEKYRKALGFIPGISCICICNSLAMNACHKDSDIDLFIISHKNRIWTTRVLITLFFMCLRERKTQNKHAGKFCLSFFISEDAPSFETFAIERDIYLAYWIETLIPVVNKEWNFEDFLQKNTWYSIENQIKPEHQHKNQGTKRYNNTFFEFSWNIIEKWLKRLLFPKTQKSFQNLWKPFGVIISDTILKFHDKDQRKIISQKVFE
jgi:hypothetical protein